MKKTAIALAVAGLAVASAAHAAPQANTFYVGAKAGWASFHDGLKYHSELLGEDFGYLRNSVTYGLFGGYQFTENFALELGYDDFGRAKFRQNGITTDKHTAHGAHLSLKASYPLIEGLDVYARVGAALVRSDYKIYTPEGPFEGDQNSLKVSPLFAGGVEYSLPSLPELAFRVEYQWLNKVGKFEEEEGGRFDYTPSIGAVTAGLSYRFGQGAAPVAAEVVNKAFTLNSDVTFAFDKAKLKPEAHQVLDGVYAEINQLKAPQVKVAGYTDRIGSEAYNMKLSQQRAQSVANYLVAKGVAQQDISATGYGKADPVTANNCDGVKGRKALIACLAPDRRVEISVKGNREITM
ncbi:OOP family OmpA-OmpF porin [Mesocricetibacter intestinalis]|uniref:Outer membrane protein A n=1 Tax=Mesocricetibacter intestinalis TaxID=1521930 RepID=A0A4V3D9P3_9PAST|nr:porin OmpA [Mesocricetibacter intestinalis]TDQ57158.1 OOP family OmpA-OmpF porin [Mesocricetibacter intestinalis]